MGYLSIILTLTALLCPVAAGQNKRAPVFLEKQDASGLISRHRRANEGDEEKLLPPDLERECHQEVCTYEEAREVFQDTYRTDIFWSVYVDGDQCTGQPCKNGAMCSDSVGGYDCICKSGFSGVHCETDQTVCVLDKTKGCSQFCKPGYQSYECSCARGWKIQQKEKCIPAVKFPCGWVNSLSQWDNRQSANVQSGYEGLNCNSEECPWQALLRNSVSSGFCSGVILKENLVLTTAQCTKKYPDFQVVVGKYSATHKPEEQTLYVKEVHVHPRYMEPGPENDLALLELRDRIVFKNSVVAACLPERDFADSILMGGELMGVVTGWKDAAEVQGNLRLNHLNYQTLPVCQERHGAQISNKMACTLPSSKADCFFGPGSPVLTLYRKVFFLTGMVSQAPGLDCKNGYVLQKVSRFLPWLKPFMDLA